MSHLGHTKYLRDIFCARQSRQFMTSFTRSAWPAPAFLSSPPYHSMANSKFNRARRHVSVIWGEVGDAHNNFPFTGEVGDANLINNVTQESCQFVFRKIENHPVSFHATDLLLLVLLFAAGSLSLVVVVAIIIIMNQGEGTSLENCVESERLGCCLLFSLPNEDRLNH